MGEIDFGDGLSPNSIASRSPSRVPHREPQTTCAQKTLILYTASGYIDQQTKKFVRRGRNACLEELKEKHGVKASGSTLDRIGTVQGTIEDSSFTGDGKDDVRVDVLQQPSNSPDCNIWDIGGFNAHQKEFKRLEAFTNNKQRMMELVYRAWDNILGSNG